MERKNKEEEEIKEKRKNEVMMKIEEIKQERELKKKEMIDNTKKIFSANRTPKYIELEKRFEEEIVLPDLEEKKKQLQQLRELYKPINKKELESHSKKVDRFFRKTEE